MRRRLARRISSLRSIHGSETSHSSATMTIAVATSATVTSAPCGSREEDDAVGGAGNVLERADHLGLAAAGLRGDGDRRPHAERELLAEGLHQALLVAGDLGVALGDELLPVTRAHPQELHVAIMSRGVRREARAR